MKCGAAGKIQKGCSSNLKQSKSIHGYISFYLVTLAVELFTKQGIHM